MQHTDMQNSNIAVYDMMATGKKQMCESADVATGSALINCNLLV